MGDFCVCKVLEVVEETTFEVKRFCFPLQTLNSLLRVFFFRISHFLLDDIFPSDIIVFKSWVISVRHDRTQCSSLFIAQVVLTHKRSKKLVHDLYPALVCFFVFTTYLLT